MRKSNVVALVMLRGNSSRLPQKHMRMVGDTTLLEHLIRNLSTAKSINSIQLCIPRGDVYLSISRYLDYIAQLTVRYPNLSAHENPAGLADEDIGGRIALRASRTNAAQYVIISGDCPLIDGATVDYMVAQAQANQGIDYVNLLNDGMLTHVGVDVLNASAIAKLGYNENICMDRYRGLSGINIQPLFRDVQFKASVDTHADLYFMRECARLLAVRGLSLTYTNVCDLVLRTPALTMINPAPQVPPVVTRRRFVLVTHGGDAHGMGHVSRTIAHAQLLGDVQGNVVHIIVNDHPAAIAALTEAGYERHLDFTIKPDHMRAFDVIPATFVYDVICYDTPWQQWFDSMAVVDDPTYLTNRRIPYLGATCTAPTSDAVVTFGCGAYAQYAAMCVDKYVSNEDYIVPKSVPFSTLIAMMANTKAVYTMWSNTARECLTLGGPHLYVLTANPKDDMICSILDQRGVLTWLGNVSQFDA